MQHVLVVGCDRVLKLPEDPECNDVEMIPVPSAVFIDQFRMFPEITGQAGCQFKGGTVSGGTVITCRAHRDRRDGMGNRGSDHAEFGVLHLMVCDGNDLEFIGVLLAGGVTLRTPEVERVALASRDFQQALDLFLGRAPVGRIIRVHLYPGCPGQQLATLTEDI